MFTSHVVRVTSLSLHSAIFIIILGHYPPKCFSIPIHLCLHYHWHLHNLSMTKRASVHYLIAAVRNIRNNLSDTPTMLVMIDTTFKSMHTRSQVDVLICTFLVLTSLLCSTGIAAIRYRKHFWFLPFFLSASSGVSLSFLSLYCSCLHQRSFSISIQQEQWTPPSINLHGLRQFSTRITHLDINHYTYQIWQSSNLRR